MSDTDKQIVRILGLAEKLGAHNQQITEMMRLMVKDNLGAMAYGQFGGSFPNPTQNAVIAPWKEGDTETNPGQIWARDNQAENDYADYLDDLGVAEEWLKSLAAGAKVAEDALAHADFLRRKYMSANMDIKNRLDPTDWCRLHFHLGIYEGHRRYKGDRCKICQVFVDENGREPTATEADYYHRHGRWPHRLVDPKERRAV